MEEEMRDRLGHDPVPAVDPQAMYPGRPAAIVDALESRTLGGEEVEDGRSAPAPAAGASLQSDPNAGEPPD